MTVRVCKTESQEADALREFWAQTVDPSSQAVVPLIGFNSRAFDLPLLMVRSRREAPSRWTVKRVIFMGDGTQGSPGSGPRDQAQRTMGRAGGSTDQIFSIL